MYQIVAKINFLPSQSVDKADLIAIGAEKTVNCTEQEAQLLEALTSVAINMTLLASQRPQELGPGIPQATATRYSGSVLPQTAANPATTSAAPIEAIEAPAVPRKPEKTGSTQCILSFAQPIVFRC